MAEMTIQIPDVLVGELNRIAQRQHRTVKQQVEYYIMESMLRDMPDGKFVYGSDGKLIGIMTIESIP